jgi:uncharacterized protein YutE (UPF0331/DUF86 family)
MTRADVLTRKVRYLQENCAYLRGVRAIAKARFLEDRTLQLAVERALQEAIEACLDIGRLLLLDVGAPLPDTNRGVFLALAQHTLVPGEGIERWADMAGFRNILVHGYDDVDLEIVYQVLRDRLDDLEAFGRLATAHLPPDVPPTPPQGPNA